MSMDLKQLNPWGDAVLTTVQTYSETFRGNTFHWKKLRLDPALLGEVLTQRLSETELEVATAPDPDPDDTTAPTLSNASAAATGASTAEGTVGTDEADGVLYWVVTTSSTAPSAAQVKAGQNDSGSAAAAAGAHLVGVTGTQGIAASGLSSSTTYYIHYMHEDEAENQSSVASSGFITTS